jgi:hypothetical protein
MGLAVKTDGAAVASGAITESLYLTAAAAEGVKYEAGWILGTTTTVKIFIDIFIGIWAFILAYIWTTRINVRPGDKARASEIWDRFPKFVLGYIVTFVVVLLLSLGASRADVARDTQYYQDNIGKITSVDQFLKDKRLFSIAMKANGLEDMTFATAFMRKVLESDLSDTNSFANKLADTRYVAFAKQFNFTTTGAVQSNLTYAQDNAQLDDTTGLYSKHRVNQGVAAATEAQYYQAKIPTLTSVDGLISDPRLFSYALTAASIDPTIASESVIRNVLTSDLSDPNSVANLIGDTVATAGFARRSCEIRAPTRLISSSDVPGAPLACSTKCPSRNSGSHSPPKKGSSASAPPHRRIAGTSTSTGRAVNFARTTSNSLTGVVISVSNVPENFS